MKLEFSRQIFEKYSNKNFMNIRPLWAELYHVDGRTDRQTDRHEKADIHFSHSAIPA
jgi:hypothetical protein